MADEQVAHSVDRLARRRNIRRARVEDALEAISCRCRQQLKGGGLLAYERLKVALDPRIPAVN
jgi:hypothetical protein